MGRCIKNLISSTLLAFGLGLFGAGQIAAATCELDKVDLRGDWGTARFTVEIADDDAERGQGLMNRESMAASFGMLFVYPKPQRATFWMRNTLIGLDMIFMDETGVVKNIHEGAIPLDETTIDGGEGILSVLEINAGMVSAMGISVGSQLRHQSFAQESAIWPCEDD